MKVECPNCLGAKTTVKGNRVKECTICNATGELEEELAEDYVQHWRNDLLLDED